MAADDRLQYLWRECNDLLVSADHIDKALELASHTEFAERLQGIRRLRDLEHGLAGIAEHCHSENRAVESALHHFLEPESYRQIVSEHDKILQLLCSFQAELRFATADATAAIVPLGRELVDQLRTHIGRERRLLQRIGQLADRPEDILSWCT